MSGLVWETCNDMKAYFLKGIELPVRDSAISAGIGECECARAEFQI